MSDKQRSFRTLEASISEYQQLVNDAIKQRKAATIILTIKVDRGKVDFVRVAPNYEYRPQDFGE